MKSKHLLLMLLLALFAPWAANAQDRTLVTIGDGTSTQNYPLPGYYGWNYDVFLYTPSAAAALGIDCDISSIAFYVSYNSTNTGAQMEMWVKDVDADYELAAATTFSTYITDATKVYENTEFSSTSGWNTLTFSSTFSHEGGKALLVAVRGVGCSTSGGCSRSCYYTTASNTYWYYRKDSTDPGQEVSGTVINNRANIQLDLTYTGAVCLTPSDLAASNLTDNSATLSWTENGEGTAWVLQYGTDNTFATNTEVNVSGTPTKDIASLSATTTYYARVKPSCDTDGSHWSETATFTTTAVATAVGDSWSDDFEGESCGWQLINGELTNAWAWGTAVNNGGNYALYVSNDVGTTNAYTNNSAAMVYATKLLTFTEGKFEFSYNWNANGESSYDYLRVALVPASVALTAGTSTPSGFSATALPTGWIALDGGGKLNLATAWQSKSVPVNVTAGNYYLVLAWRNDSSGGTNPPAAVDNVSITRVACPYDVEDLAVSNITTNSATVTWTAGEATEWQVAKKAASDADWTILSGTYTNPTASLTGLTEATTYQVKVRAYCNATNQGSWCEPVTFTTACNAMDLSTMDYEENFDDLEVASAYTAPAARVLPTCWSAINTTTYSSYAVFPTAYYYSYTNYANSTPNCLKFYSSYSSYSDYDPQDEYAILPPMEDLSGKQITLWVRGNNTTSTFKVGTMTDPDDATSFTEITNDGNPAISTSYQEYTFIIPSTFTGNYIAIMMEAANSTTTTMGIYVDDITIADAPTCIKPTALEFVSSTTTTATISWTNGAEGQTAWQIAYSTDATFDPDDVTPVAVTTNPGTINNLTPATTYYAYVRANCGTDGYSDWSANYVEFATACEAINLSTMDYEENFDDLEVASAYTAPAARVLPTCWSAINTTTYSSYAVFPTAYYYSYTNYANSTPNCLKFYSSYSSYSDYDPQDQYAILPPMENLAGKQITLWVRGYYSSCTFKVGTMTNPADVTTFTEITNEGNPALSTSYQEYTYIIPSTFTGNYVAIMIDAADYYTNSYNGIYVDDITIANPPTCAKPSALMLETPSARTAHTATLKWTNGAEGQTDWQIAYSTSSTFAPADDFTPGENEWLVSVTTNPATLEGLAQSTTYYAYVRANCGGGDYSAWCNNKATFTTLAGNVTPSGLAVAASTITSSQATASWNAVEGNTLHENYDIYWAESTVTAVPDEPAAPNLIAGITATSQIISGLEPETAYKVWVRDNCGDDGTSAWSSAVTFTTASACQTPDGLAASNVTISSATITWNTYGLTAFNLKYSSDGGTTWTTKSNVSSPYNLTELSENTAYQVQVQASCNTEAWSSVLNFSTPCIPITITESAPYTEDFEDPVTTAVYNTTSVADLVMPGCWDNYTSNTSNAYAIPHIIKSDAGTSGYNYSNPASQVLYFYGSGYGYAALPEFTNALNTLQISFKWATEGSTQGTLKLGYITAEDDGTYNTFTQIGESLASTSSSSPSYRQMKSETVYLNAVPAEATRLVFCWYYSSWYGCNIDDVEVALAPAFTKTINAYSGDGGYYLIASPLAEAIAPTAVTNMISDELGATATTTTSTYDLYFFDQAENDEWRNYRANTFNLENGKGYLYASKNGAALTFTGAPYNGDGVVSLAYSTDNADVNMRGWNLIGNPFAISAILDKPYYRMNSTGSALNTATETTAVAAMEGIFVKATEAGQSATFTAQTRGSEQVSIAQVNIVISNDKDNALDNAIIRFDNGSTLEKFSFREGSSKVYIPQDGKDYAVVNAEAQGELPLNFKAEKNGSYTLSFGNENVEFGYLHLIDNMTGNDVNLLETPSYSFEAKTTDYASRFRLVFATGNNGTDETFAFFNNGNLVINNEGNATLQVVDVMGRILRSETINGSANVNVNAAPGVYVIRLINGDNVRTQKVVVE